MLTTKENITTHEKSNQIFRCMFSAARLTNNQTEQKHHLKIKCLHREREGFNARMRWGIWKTNEIDGKNICKQWTRTGMESLVLWEREWEREVKTKIKSEQ